VARRNIDPVPTPIRARNAKSNAKGMGTKERAVRAIKYRIAQIIRGRGSREAASLAAGTWAAEWTSRVAVLKSPAAPKPIPCSAIIAGVAAPSPKSTEVPAADARPLRATMIVLSLREGMPLAIDSMEVPESAIDLWFRTAGSQGPAVVLLHGLGAGSQVWQGVSRLMETRFRLFIPDLRGHGQSPSPLDGYLPEDYAADVLKLMVRLDIPWAHLVGHSLGALVAAAFAARWPNCMDKLVLVDPGIGPTAHRMLGIFLDLLNLRQEGKEALIAYLKLHQPWASRATLELTADLWSRVSVKAVQAVLDNPGAFFDIAEKYFERIYAPTLIIGGDPGQQALLDESTGQRLASMLRHGRYVKIPGAPHAVHAVKLKEFVDLVTQFLEAP
jgi:N-formylmaleamate deformylase